jgi:hypothetical protein
MAKLASMRWRDWYSRGRYVPGGLPPNFPHRRKKSGQGSQVIRRSSQQAAERPCLFHSLRKGSVPFGIKVFKWPSARWTNQVPVRFCDQCAQAFQQKGVQHHKSTDIWWFAASGNRWRGEASEAALVEAYHAPGCFFHLGASPAASIDIRLMAYGDEFLCTDWLRVGVCNRCQEVFVAGRALKMKQAHVWWQIRPEESPTSKRQPVSTGGTSSVGGGNPTPDYKKFGKKAPEPGYRGKGIRRDLPRR